MAAVISGSTCLLCILTSGHERLGPDGDARSSSQVQSIDHVGMLDSDSTLPVFIDNILCTTNVFWCRWGGGALRTLAVTLENHENTLMGLSM